MEFFSKYKLLKKQCYLLLCLIVLLISLLIFLGFNAFWALFVLCPIFLCVDICFILLPLSLTAFILLSIISFWKKNFEAYNYLFANLAFMVTIGFFDACLETFMLDNVDELFNFPILVVYFLVLLTILGNIMYIYRKKDTRLYTFAILPIFILFIAYKLVEILS